MYFKYAWLYNDDTLISTGNWFKLYCDVGISRACKDQCCNTRNLDQSCMLLFLFGNVQRSWRGCLKRYIGQKKTSNWCSFTHLQNCYIIIIHYLFKIYDYFYYNHLFYFIILILFYFIIILLLIELNWIYYFI